jgi:hypothetical protein
MSNPRKNKILKKIWFKPKEYIDLVSNLQSNQREEVFKILMDAYQRGDFDD